MRLTDRTITTTIKNGFLHVIIPDTTAESGYRSHRLAVDKTFINRGVLFNNSALNAEAYHVYHTDISTTDLPASANVIGILKASNNDNPGLIYETFTGGVYEIWTRKNNSGTWAAWTKLESGGGITDHGALTGLADDDHPQYNHKSYNTQNYLGAGYTLGGTEKPNNFGSGKLRVQMLRGSSGLNLGAPNTWCDVLWLSSYSGGDVKGSNALILGKNSDSIGFCRQNYDSTSWGAYREIYHSGSSSIKVPNFYINDANTRLTEGAGNAIRNQTNSGYIDVGAQNTSWAHLTTDRANFYFNKAIHATDFVLYSDKYFKKRVKPINDALAKVLQLKGVTFYWNEKAKKIDRYKTGREIGFIANQVERIVPEVVATTIDGHKTISYSKLVALNSSAIRELYELIKTKL